MLQALLRCAIIAICFASVPVAADDSQEQVEFFESRIRPVLVKHCYECHTDDAKGGLRLDDRRSTLKGGDSGPAVVPKDVSASLLISAIKYDDFEMPPNGKLPDRVIADFAKWIEMGAADPREALAKDVAVVSASKKQIDFESARQLWAFQTPMAKALPAVRQSGWPNRRIDFFVLSQLESKQLAPSSEADRRTLIRRLSYDLTGLPPTPDEVDRFELDSSLDAYARLVDRLLASPRFGERWARVWLDVARYAEDQAHIVGNNQSLFYPNAFYYRDWVIGAFNSDMPYDRFVSLQIAADLVAPEQPEEHAALGFIGLGPKYYNRGRIDVMADEWEDRVDTVSRGLLGLTVACARCHDHKYDPISTEDYYGLAGIFASTDMFNRPLQEQEAGKGKKGKPKPKDCMHIVRDGSATDLHVFVRGNVEQKGPLVKRRFPEVFGSSASLAIAEGSGRAELARAIIDSRNPLTSRVMVNRIFGRLIGPIVKTSSNFGKLGGPPSHPDLLDDLALRFMNNDWSIKWLVREIVTSSTYRQSSLNRHNSRMDPSNQWFGRMNRRRLSVEQWRDTLLSVGDQLDSRIGGPSIDIHDTNERRRTIYSQVSRFQLKRMLVLFDFPDANVHAASRAETTTPLQKLFVMNNSFVQEQARRLSESVMQSDDSSVGDRIMLLYRRTFHRLPSRAELRLGYEFIQDADMKPVKAWRHYAHALLASNELLFID